MKNLEWKAYLKLIGLKQSFEKGINKNKRKGNLSAVEIVIAVVISLALGIIIFKFLENAFGIDVLPEFKKRLMNLFD